MTTKGDVKEQHAKPFRETGVLDRNSELNMTASAHVRHRHVKGAGDTMKIDLGD